jgi:hypothetical protein
MFLLIVLLRERNDWYTHKPQRYECRQEIYGFHRVFSFVLYLELRSVIAGAILRSHALPKISEDLSDCVEGSYHPSSLHPFFCPTFST